MGCSWLNVDHRCKYQCQYLSQHCPESFFSFYQAIHRSLFQVAPSLGFVFFAKQIHNEIGFFSVELWQAESKTWA
jgi:hypothetical protein